MPNTNHHQICCGTDNNLGLIAAIAQDAWIQHTNGTSREEILNTLIDTFEENPHAAALAGTAIWLYATTINRDTDADPAPAFDSEFGRYGIRARQSHDGTRVMVTCGSRLVAEYPGRVQVAVIVDKILEDMGGGDAAEPEPDDQPEPLRGTISPAGQLEIAVPLDWQGEAKRAFYASVMRRNAEALLSGRPELAGKMIDVTFDPEGELLGWKLSEDSKAAGDENRFVDAGSALPPLLKVAISPEGTLSLRATSELLAASLEERVQLGERILAAANRLLGERLDLQGQRLFLLWNSASGKFESVDVLDSVIPAPTSPDWIRFPDSYADTQAAPRASTASEPLKDPEPTEAEIRDAVGDILGALGKRVRDSQERGE